MRKNLTSADITNITWLNSEYGIGNTTHTFSCEIDGEPSTIVYDLYRHDEGYGFTIHTKPEDIWMSMDTRELEKLDNILLQEAEYGRIIKQLRNIDNADELQNYRWDLCEMELNITEEQRNRIWDEFTRMEEVFE